MKTLNLTPEFINAVIKCQAIPCLGHTGVNDIEALSLFLEHIKEWRDSKDPAMMLYNLQLGLGTRPPTVVQVRFIVTDEVFLARSNADGVVIKPFKWSTQIDSALALDATATDNVWDYVPAIFDQYPRVKESDIVDELLNYRIARIATYSARYDAQTGHYDQLKLIDEVPLVSKVDSSGYVKMILREIRSISVHRPLTMTIDTLRHCVGTPTSTKRSCSTFH